MSDFLGIGTQIKNALTWFKTMCDSAYLRKPLDIIDNLESDSSDRPLSANQGKQLATTTTKIRNDLDDNIDFMNGKYVIVGAAWVNVQSPSAITAGSSVTVNKNFTLSSDKDTDILIPVMKSSGWTACSNVTVTRVTPKDGSTTSNEANLSATLLNTSSASHVGTANFVVFQLRQYQVNFAKG